jgi:transposase InsO family protein
VSQPDLSAFIERFIRSIKEECLDRVIPHGEARLRELIREYMAHYRMERPHQGLDGSLIQSTAATVQMARQSDGNGSAACSTITTEKLRESRTIQ